MPMPGIIPDICLQVYLMEANMSPNLSSAHFPPNRPVKKFNVKQILQILGLVVAIEYFSVCRLLYEQVIHSMLRLVGVIQGSVR
jgi:hypothetical protein